MLNENKVSELAKELRRSLETCNPISPLSDREQDMTIDDAYAIQMTNVKYNTDNGIKISGKKIGLTSVAMQELMGVDEPDYGHLYDTMDGDGKIKRDTMLQPKVEGEIAFVLKEDIEGPDATPEKVLEATDHVVAALEIVDSRIRDWKIKLVDTVSDNASSGSYVLGAKKFKPSDIDLISESMDFYKNGEKINSGRGADVLGDPAYCVSWLANKLWKYGVTLKKGEVVLSGAVSAAIEADAGDTFEARFSNLGSVKVEFI